MSKDPMDIRRLLHIGIIMDGNGRWATKRGLPRTEGHKQGLETAKNFVRTARQEAIPTVSLYTFSTENWRRTEEEVGFLMGLIPASLRRELPFYHEHGVRVVHSGNLDQLPLAVREAILDISEQTRSNTGITVNLAINYGGRDELLRAVRRLCVTQPNPVTWSEESLSAMLDQPQLPEPDLIIRTGGDQRLSNFLLWQSAYAELYFSDVLWPDWSDYDFKKALDDFSKRQRRFGGHS